MLKFLTHKLRTHSLNEESVSEKVGVGASRLSYVKVTPPPENGRLAREQRSGTSAGCRATRAGPSRCGRPGLACSDWLRARQPWPGLRWRCGLQPSPAIDPGVWDIVCLLQVEERDSGTESDDEADRAEPGECRRSPALRPACCHRRPVWPSWFPRFSL